MQRGRRWSGSNVKVSRRVIGIKCLDKSTLCIQAGKSEFCFSQHTVLRRSCRGGGGASKSGLEKLTAIQVGKHGIQLTSPCCFIVFPGTKLIH